MIKNEILIIFDKKNLHDSQTFIKFAVNLIISSEEIIKLTVYIPMMSINKFHQQFACLTRHIQNQHTHHQNIS